MPSTTAITTSHRISTPAAISADNRKPDWERRRLISGLIGEAIAEHYRLVAAMWHRWRLRKVEAVAAAAIRLAEGRHYSIRRHAQCIEGETSESAYSSSHTSRLDYRNRAWSLHAILHQNDDLAIHAVYESKMTANSWIPPTGIELNLSRPLKSLLGKTKMRMQAIMIILTVSGWASDIETSLQLGFILTIIVS